MSTGQADQGLYDHSTNTEMNQWTEGTKPLDDKPYNGSSKDSSDFSSKFSCQALDSGWGSITKIQGYDIFHKYGLFSIKDALAEALTRFQFDAAGVRIPTWDAQASWQMMRCLMNSCSPEALKKLHHSDIHAVISDHAEESESGPLILGILISRVVMDCCYMILFSHQLACLDQLVTKVN